MAPLELLWPQTVDDDDACRSVREHLVRIAQQLVTTPLEAAGGTGRALKRAAPARGR